MSLLAVPQMSAQDLILSLEHSGKFKRVIFEPGRFMRMKTYDSDAKISGRLHAVFDSSLMIVTSYKMANEGDTTTQVFKDVIPFDRIERVYVNTGSYWEFFRPMYAGTATVGGLVLLAGGFVNHYTDSNRTPLDPGAMSIAAGITVSGLMVGLLGGKRYKKLGKKWNIKAIEAFDPSKEKSNK